METLSVKKKGFSMFRCAYVQDSWPAQTIEDDDGISALISFHRDKGNAVIFFLALRRGERLMFFGSRSDAAG